MAKHGDGRISIYPILSVNFVGTLGFSIVLPFLVFLVMRWGGNALVYGVIGATYSAFQLVGAPILGRWSDVHGRRRILLLSQIGTLASWILLALAFAVPSVSLLNVDSRLLGQFSLTLPLLLLFVARALDGVTGGNVSVANAYLADITDEEHRNADFGKMAVSANLGFILGPAIAGTLGATRFGELLPVLAAVTVSVVATLIIARMLPESRPRRIPDDLEQASVRKVFGHEQKPCYEPDCTGTKPLSTVLLQNRIPVLLTIYFLVMLGFNFFYISFPVYAVQGLGWNVGDTGLFFAVMALLMVLVQGPLLGRASKRWSDAALVVTGSLVLATSFLFFVSRETTVIYVGAALLAVGNGFMWPSVVSLLSKAAGDTYQGAVQGFASSTGAVASILGLVGGGILFGSLESRIFIAPAATVFATFVLSLGLLRRSTSG